MSRKHVGTLRVLARAYASPLIAMVGAVALGAGKVKKTLSPALYDRVMALLSSMVKRAAPQITHLIVDAPLRMAGRAWREVSRAFTAAAAAADTPAGKQNGAKSLVAGSGSSLQLAGAGEVADTRVKLHLWTNQSEEQLRALQSTAQQGQSVASARPAPGSTGGAGLAAAPITMGSSGLMSLASATPKVIVDAPTVMSAGAGILQAMEIAKAWKKMEVGTAKERRDAIFSFFSAGLGVMLLLKETLSSMRGW